MNDLEQVAAAIRTAESRDDYRHQALVDIGGQPVRKVGAYGIRLDRWAELTEAASLAGADWNDRAAQDAIARRKLQHDYEQLGDWNLTAVAFRFGLNAAIALRDRGLSDPASIEKSGYPEVASYMRAVRDGNPMLDKPVSGRLRTGKTENGAPNPNAKRAQDIVRKQLYGLRNQQRKAWQAESQEQPEQADEQVAE